MFRSILFAVVLTLPAMAMSALAGGDAVTSEQLRNVSFRDPGGKMFSLNEMKGKKATVIVFLSFDCPVAKSYCEPLARLAKAYSDVCFIALTCNDEETPAQVAKHATEFNLPFRLFKDDHNVAADALQAEITPEAFLLDADLKLCYRGRIDNAYAARLKKNNQITRHELRQAMDELLAGKSITEKSTKAIGCSIERKKESKTIAGDLTFHRDVLPILQNHCQGCHRPGEVGPFALMHYRQAINWAADIKEFTQNHKMPPWKPTAGVKFQDERKLTEKEIATIAEWVLHGTPEGDPKDSPPARQFPGGWQLGQPDLVLSVPEGLHLGASGNDLFRCFVLPTNMPEDKYISAIEVRPGNSRILHHTLLAVDARGQGRKLEREQQKIDTPATLDRGPGYTVAMGFGFPPQGGMGGWAPGQMPRFLPEGTGYFLPKGADIVMQVHYHRVGKAEEDRTVIGIHFAKKPVDRRFQSLALPGRFRTIPAGENHYVVKGMIWVNQDCVLYTVLPHMHMLGREIKVTMTEPDGKSQQLVTILDWDYNWQETYFLKDPLHLKAGTRFDVVAAYDNSAGNPSNPAKPPKNVVFGQQTTDEMCFVFLGGCSEKPGRVRALLQPPKTEQLEKP